MSLESGSFFQAELSSAIEAREPDRVVELAQNLRESEFVAEAHAVLHGEELIDLLGRLRESGVPPQNDLADMVRDIVGADAPESFAGDLARVQDSVLAAYLLDEDASADVALEMVRAYQIVGDVLSGYADRAHVESMLHGRIALPEFLTPPAAEEVPEQAPGDVADELVQRIGELSRQHDRLSEAIGEVQAHAEDELELVEGGARSLLSDAYHTVAERPREDRPSGEQRRPTPEPAWDAARSSLLRAATGRNVMLSARALDQMSESVVDTVRGQDLDPAGTPIRDLEAGLARSQGETGLQLLQLTGQFADLVTTVDKARLGLQIDARWRVEPVDNPELQPPVSVTAPGATPTPVTPLGVADLLLIRSHISRYERSEVAAIENVLPHDVLTHTTRSLDTTETTSTEENERTDLRSLTQSTAEDEKSSATVQAVGPGVGPLASEGAGNFARHVTDQVSSASTSRTRRALIERRLHEREDTLQHVIENVGDETAYGVYQWLDKIYEARLFNYGSRLLYDVIVPEPAALFRMALSRPRSGLPMPVRPAPFAVRPEDLTSYNWAYYATGHHASGVEAPPPERIVVSEPFGKQASDPFAMDSSTCTLTWAEARTTRIPKGYRATKYAAVVMATGFPAGVAAVSIGTKSFMLQGPHGVYRRMGGLDGERDSIPVAVDVSSDGANWGVSDLTVAVEIVCEATDELMSAWQVKAHDQIAAANRRRYEEYAEAAATRDATARLTLNALSEERKAQIVSTEVKRTVLSYLTGQTFAGFNATALDPAGFPYPHAGATGALASYIRFLENAIEWNHVAHAFLPYFWGAQTSWVAKLVSSDPDRRFADFLSSGAARVVLPVRPGYETAFERFLRKGAVPTTDELLDVGGALWVSLADELREQASPEGEESAVGEPWEFRIASDLLRARTDGSMPRWTFAGDAWADSADPDY
jgi:hypothetical protein